jgi:hypothetical protein
MTHMQKICVIVRDFYSNAGRLGADGKLVSIPEDSFLKKSGAVVKLLESSLVDHVLIVSNRDGGSEFGETPDSASETPTWQMYRLHYEDLVHTGKLHCCFVDEWGANAGSGRAVQAGIDHFLGLQDDVNNIVSHAMVWSPELAIDNVRFAQAAWALEHYNLDGLGFLREHAFTRTQWMLPQHTGLLGTKEFWSLAEVPTYTDGDEGLSVDTSEGLCPLAGMDDMARIFEALKVKQDLSIGMFGQKNPIAWNVDLTDPRQAPKVARQQAVTEEWARRSFPDTEPAITIANFVAHLKLL